MREIQQVTKFYILMLLICFSCSSTKNKIVCDENLEFKSEYFRNIMIIEDFLADGTKVSNIEEYENLLTEERLKAYELALKFVSKYSHVSFDFMANYDRSYPIGVFEKDKIVWLKWYENNKCNNIQFK